MAGRSCFRSLVTLCAAACCSKACVASGGNSCEQGAGDDADISSLLQKVLINKKQEVTALKIRSGGARASVLAQETEVLETAGPAASASAAVDPQEGPSTGQVPSRHQALLVAGVAVLALFGLRCLTSTVAPFRASSGETSEQADADRSLPPGVLICMMVCAFLSEASCTAAVPTAHLCAGGLSYTIAAWFIGRLLSAPVFWHLEKQGLTQISLGVFCVAMVAGQFLYGVSAAMLLLPSATSGAAVAAEAPIVLFHRLLMAGRGAVGFASGAQFSASAAIVAEAGNGRRTEYLCYWAFWSGLGALAGPGPGYLLAGAGAGPEMLLLPGAVLAGTSLLLLYALPMLVSSKASSRLALAAGTEVLQLSPSELRRTAGAVALNVFMQLARQAMCLLWQAGTAAVLVKQFGLDSHLARTSVLGMVASSLMVLAVLARYVGNVGNSDERIVLMWASAAAAFGCLIRSQFHAAADGVLILAFGAFLGHAGSFLSLAPMLGFAGKVVSADAAGAQSPSSITSWRRVLMSHHMVSSAGLTMSLATLQSPGSAAEAHTPGLAGFVLHFMVLVLIAVQVFPQMVGRWPSPAKLQSAYAQQRL